MAVSNKTNNGNVIILRDNVAFASLKERMYNYVSRHVDLEASLKKDKQWKYNYTSRQCSPQASLRERMYNYVSRQVDLEASLKQDKQWKYNYTSRQCSPCQSQRKNV